MTEQMKIKGETCLIKEKCLKIALEEANQTELEVSYSMWRVKIGDVSYALEISSKNERAVIFVGENEDDASKFFERLFEENTLPGNLYDLYRDMLTDETDRDLR